MTAAVFSFTYPPESAMMVFSDYQKQRILYYRRLGKCHAEIAHRLTKEGRSIFNSVVLSTLLYGLETAVFLEPQINRLQSFVMRCLRSILGVSLQDGQRDTSIRKTAHIQRVSSMLTQSRLRLLGHIMRMLEDRLPRQLLVCAPAHGRRSAEGDRSCSGMTWC